MKNFKIVFRVITIDKTGARIGAGSFVRIISAKNRDWAVGIANAMIDEELSFGQYIDKVELLEETGEEAFVGGGDNHKCWLRVMNKLKLEEKKIDWVVSKKDPLKIVGMIPKKSP